GEVGPLVGDQPVITIVRDPNSPGYLGEYGPNTGVLPYPETFFAPFATAAAAVGSGSGVGTATPPANIPPANIPDPSPMPTDSPSAALVPAPGDVPEDPARGRVLGIDAEPVE